MQEYDEFHAKEIIEEAKRLVPEVVNEALVRGHNPLHGVLMFADARCADGQKLAVEAEVARGVSRAAAEENARRRSPEDTPVVVALWMDFDAAARFGLTLDVSGMFNCPTSPPEIPGGSWIHTMSIVPGAVVEEVVPFPRSPVRG
jgi:hypothetical protein